MPRADSTFELRGPWREERPAGSGVYVRLHDNIRDCIVYLGLQPPGSETFEGLGTGFLIEFEGACYVVTAAHVALAVGDGGFALRVNRKDSEDAESIHFDTANWTFHPDDTVDVAVMPFDVPEAAETSPWVPRWFISKEKRVEKNIGAGDLAHIVGMYKFLPGKRKVCPIVHTGHIATMADGQMIPAGDWRPGREKQPIEIEGYLVEAQTLDCLSGSPVFVRRSIQAMALVPDVDPNPIKVWLHGTIWLLGLWHGAWFGEPDSTVGITSSRPVKISAGMGVVVPAYRIVEVLNLPELAMQRTKKKEAETFPVEAAARDVPPEELVLKKMLETPPQPKVAKPQRSDKA